MKNYPIPADLLPHQEPILFVDNILDFKPGKFIVAEKMIKEDNPFFKGHFPGYPLLPGVILIEALFQCCGLFNRMEMESLRSGNNSPDLAQNSLQNSSGRAIKIDKFVFKQEVRPNTRLVLKVELKSRIMNFTVFNGTVFIEDKVVSKGEITTSILKK